MLLLINNSKPNLADLHYMKYIRKFLKKSSIDFVETKKIEDISPKIKGIIISGSPLILSKPLLLEDYGYILHYLLKYPNIPVLGICFGCQLLSMICGGFTLEHQSRYLCKKMDVNIDDSHRLLSSVSMSRSIECQFCFSDLIIPNKKLNNTREIAWFNYKNKKMPCAFDFSNDKYGTLFHPEFFDNTHYIIRNFYIICISK
jgi:anthranilate/para-aminobenzoate synthase component II